MLQMIEQQEWAKLAITLWHMDHRDFVHPALTVTSTLRLLLNGFPYLITDSLEKKACLILLQTILDTMDMDKFERFQISKFPQTEMPKEQQTQIALGSENPCRCVSILNTAPVDA
uniref:Uncharacterized protein n=1 Tax=Glossina morsitans morsitans TaxID=37546 RepID=A0A1B0G2S8_GLOMM